MLAKLRSPVLHLTAANLFGAAVGFISGMLTARWLGAEAYGVMGILTAVNPIGAIQRLSTISACWLGVLAVGIALRYKKEIVSLEGLFLHPGKYALLHPGEKFASRPSANSLFRP